MNVKSTSWCHVIGRLETKQVCIIKCLILVCYSNVKEYAIYNKNLIIIYTKQLIIEKNKLHKIVILKYLQIFHVLNVKK